MKKVFSGKSKKLFFIMTIIGPGLITVNAGNDAGGITTYATVGASYGYKMLWGLLLITFSLAVIQEMNARMAVVTGKGLSDLIREKFGVKLTFFAMSILLIANMGVVFGDFAGIAASLELFGISKFISIPIVSIAIWLLVTKGSYKKVENIFLLFTFVFFTYIISAFLTKPDWGNVFRSMATPTIELNSGFLLTFIGMIGTTITPYMQFYLQSSIVDKKLSLSDYKYEKLDVYLGSFWGNAVAFFIIVCTAVTLYKAGISINSAEEAALALKPLAGDAAFMLFGAGLFGASVLATAVIPLSTSYAICEAFGWESGVDNDYKDAPAFFGIYTGIIILGALFILIPGISLIDIILATQQIAGLLSPIILTFMIILINDKRIMGKHINTKVQNIISWATVLFIITLSVILFASQLIG
ncbi:NRAMP (natural resistance-associated macrophage protein)-like metal ion transporter [Clostridium saccharoperbutylacetonicum]|uniref:Mn2+ and Fe2+ transporters of the NRAMP family n=1 Tax=Clostridium saccharoperbutylacetonicum N1-4(HMT) TaxID=931276 RepID=M1LRC6_9CLOT|nr:Nramp family divalent metal transporter [Clostridium saccharoperbutylacetonicum]AGF55485.1 Mn2+ and Fe2+ transporters of the NRAMP family [Clostridium saccharoperbutylacetonicum N1-4(HMT)]NRT63797.1 NRAMP (natural resistance-associated macrophage protein)-like metal ion transporter [Clostridium saccharoperbutylacetonicum]NSB27160.1 NRAMP (natural resistance-associated macrophage protein)-like metal ion transporter [Clostridium saccharoperbutylacetonicum]NSB40646.1 NRAMP (natural resistance-a